MDATTTENLLSKIEELENRLRESEELIEAIKEGEVDAFAFKRDDKPEVFTLQSGDYAYRILVENFGEGALNLTEDGLIVYSNSYFHQLIRLPYEKAIGSYIFSFINPNSQDAFKELFKKGLAGQSKGEINFLVNGKVIPAYVSLTSLYPKLPTVGMIVTDLSEKKLREEELQQKNMELEQSNAELASFTYIASHDLQEPLRKIQTFSNRILEKENENFSEKTKDYFNRIISASERMQNLITALLKYSQMNTSEMLFTATNLNIVMREVANSLTDIIEDTHTIIETAKLPTLNVVPYQINQLFTNIIYNAIKYKRPNVAPIIKITSEVATPQEQHANGFLPTEKVYRIAIADNGIGFDQQYAIKIFELFQRLHGRTEYQGTGIGLAICKKIIQSHGGAIRADGVRGKGAIFIIYLPDRK